MTKKVITEIEIPGISKRSGKVRDIFEVPSPRPGTTRPELLLIASTDRVSAFDLVLPTGIPKKGEILNQLSIFWMELLKEIIPNHLYSSDSEYCLAHVRPDSHWRGEELRERVVLVKRAEVVPIECVVRGYITGSLWKEYLEVREKRIFGPDRILVQGHWLPRNLKESEELPLSIFTPSTKAQTGHDVNLDYEGMVEHLSRWLEKKPEIKRYFEVNLLAQALRSTSLALYLVARNYARQCGIIIADTKFEFGFIDNQLHLIDEILTPDSSRFWDSIKYKPGGPQASYDKQPLRDWLTESGWNKEPPAPELPEEIVIATTERYREAYRRITGRK